MHDAVESFRVVGMQFAYTLSLECYLDTYYATSLNAQTGDGFLVSCQQLVPGFHRKMCERPVSLNLVKNDFHGGFLILQQALYGFVVDVFQGV